MKFRTWMNIITVILLALVVFLARDQIVQAWNLMGKVNLWIFVLLIPIQLFSYYAVGEVMFSYLRSKKNLGTMSRWGMARTALELNFVNHIIPVPSIAGFSYLGFVLKKHNVSMGRATMAQIIRYVMMFASFVVLMVISVVILSFDHKVNRTIIIICGAFVVAAIVCIASLIYMIDNQKRLTKFSGWLTRNINNLIFRLTFGKKSNILDLKKVNRFFVEIHDDYLEIRRDKSILTQPLIWAILGNLSDVLLIFVAFLSLGIVVNPATLFVAFGVASFAAVFAATPGGSGAYEAIMIASLISAGVPANAAIAGTLIARATLLAGTIIFGYIFYQLTINKYGKIDETTNI